MPPLPDVPNVLKAQLQWADDLDMACTTTLFFSFTGEQPSIASTNSLAEALWTTTGAHNTLWSEAVALTGVKLTDLTSDTSAVGQYTASQPGTDTSVSLAGGTAVVVGYQIARRYRGGKPRSYLPWGTTADLVSRQQWTNIFVTNVSAALTAITSGFSGIEVGGCTIAAHINVSYYAGFTVEGGTGGKRAKNVSTPRATPLTDVIVGNTVLTHPGSQRRRNRS